ncbi:MAG TPA: nicotinate-nucleotide adenylyltransferase [Thermomicrobiales bacterium]|nr:nicotinate-nucleotide adenylyltransferase [Thermomicrobiales bacterium]
MSEGARLGLYGGTFDPVHVGHLVAAAEVHFALGLDRVLFLPAGQPPHKQGQTITPAAARARMIGLAIAGRPQFALSTLDLEGAAPSYTADLLVRARAAWGADADLYFIMGEDSLRDFPGWREPARVAALARLAVVTRPNVAVDVAAIERAVPTLAGRVHCVPIPEIDVASHDLRARVAAGRPIAYQVPPAVEAYIREHGLYRATSDEPVMSDE